VRERLEEVGIPFPEGSSMLYDARHPKLIVVNSRENLELIVVYTTAPCLMGGAAGGT